MVNDTVKYAGLHMTEETFKVSDKPILLTSLLFDRSSSEDQPVAGPGSPLRIDLLNQFIKLFVETLAKDDDVNERVLIDMIAFNHEVEIVGGSDFAHPRDIAIPVLTAAGGTDYDLALNTAIDRSRARYNLGKKAGQEHYVPIVIEVGDFEDTLSQETAQRVRQLMENKDMQFDGFATVPLNPEDPNFCTPQLWCMKEAVPDPRRRLAVQHYNDLPDGYKQYAELKAMSIKIRTRTGLGEKPVIAPEEDPTQKPESKLIVPQLGDLI